MNKLLLAVCLIGILPVHAQETVVFESGEDGYASYRIPAIIQRTSGELIAFAEGRVDNAGDYGNVDIVYKISKDGGITWGPLKIAVDYADLQAGNAAPVVDLLDPRYPDGRIFLFYNTGNNHEGEVRQGNGLREVWYITSTDGGSTWAMPVNITTMVHRPNQPQLNPAYHFEEDWRTYANTPGHAIQFDSGPYKGRLYVPANHSEGDPKEAGKDYIAHAFYSDDHGEHFKLTESVPVDGSNESMAAQLSGTTVYMNSRNQQGNVRARIVSYSHDGGVTWDTSYYDTNLPDPVNQGSVLSWKADGRYMLAVCNAADEQHRDNLTLRLSEDGGKTWYFNETVAKAPEGYNGAYAAYSDLVHLNGYQIGVLYEKDNYHTIVFTAIKYPMP